MRHTTVAALAIFSFVFGLLLPVFRPVGDLELSVLSGGAVCLGIGLLWLSNRHHVKIDDEAADMAPIFLRKVPAAPAPAPAPVTDIELERKRREHTRAQNVALLSRDMVEFSAKGFSRDRWAGRKSPSGLYVSQRLWRDAMNVLERAGAIERNGGGGSARLVMSSADTLRFLGLCSTAEQEATGTLQRRHNTNTESLVRV